jgi:predicted O-methyltransferase YrrM
MMIPDEVAVLKRCAALLPDQPVIVNIGAGFGTSSAALLEVRPNAYLYSVDKHPRPEETENLQSCGLNLSRFIKIQGISWIVADDFPGTIDCLFVDGDHSNRAVVMDINAWIPKVVDGGIVAFHDYEHPNVPGLTKVVNQAMKKHEVIGKHRFLIVYKLRR